MWGTTPRCAKLTGDSGIGFEAALIGDCRLFRPLAKNQPQGFLGLLQQICQERTLALQQIREIQEIIQHWQRRAVSQASLDLPSPRVPR
jgi:hypothetical protein